MNDRRIKLERAIRRVVTRVLAEPISLELPERMKAYGSPEKFLFWCLYRMRQDFPAYARTLTNRELADSLDYNSSYAKSDMMKSVMIEAARRLRDGPRPNTLSRQDLIIRRSRQKPSLNRP